MNALAGQLVDEGIQTVLDVRSQGMRRSLRSEPVAEEILRSDPEIVKRPGPPGSAEAGRPRLAPRRRGLP